MVLLNSVRSRCGLAALIPTSMTLLHRSWCLWSLKGILARTLEGSEHTEGEAGHDWATWHNLLQPLSDALTLFLHQIHQQPASVFQSQGPNSWWYTLADRWQGHSQMHSTERAFGSWLNSLVLSPCHSTDTRLPLPLGVPRHAPAVKWIRFQGWPSHRYLEQKKEPL